MMVTFSQAPGHFSWFSHFRKVMLCCWQLILQNEALNTSTHLRRDLPKRKVCKGCFRKEGHQGWEQLFRKDIQMSSAYQAGIENVSSWTALTRSNKINSSL
jgi:hypothetical protein